MLLHDLRNAIGVWRRRPLVATAAILTFALGAGANLAVFRLLWTVMLRPLPYADSSRLLQVWQDDGKETRNSSKKELIERWRESNRSFTSLTNFRPWQITVASGSGDPETVRVGLVSSEFFSTLGVSMLAGRPFTPAETRTGADRVIVLTHGYWTRRFSADPALINREIQADGEFCQVVGILPPDFRSHAMGAANEADAYLPISRAKVGIYALPTSFVIGRLRPGVSQAQAQSDLSAIAATLPKAGAAPPARIWISPLQDEIGFSLRPALIALFGASVCVLLVACFNIANLLMAHAAARQRELAIRAAMGASRARLIQQLLVESLVLALAGGIAAFAAGSVLTEAMVALYPGGIPRAAETGGIDVASIGAAFVVALACGLLAGLLPAWRVTGGKMEDWLRVGHGWMARGRRRWADALVAAQVMLTVAVLIGAGLLMKSFLNLRGTDPGFAKEHVITAAVGLPSAAYGKRPEQAKFAAELTERLRTMPGVVAAGLTNSLPLRYTMQLSLMFRLAAGEPEQISAARAVSGEYFKAMGLQMAAGRALGPQDDGRKDVRVVNEAFVRRFLPGRDPIGLQFAAESAQIIGVVKDIRHQGLKQAAPPEIYLPLASLPSGSIGIAIRSTLPVGEITAALRRELQAMDSGIALEKVMTLEEVVNADLARPRFQTILLGLFAAIAIALAAVGAYSVVAHSLRTRTQEFGVRRAVGAQTADILKLVAFEGMRAPLLGLALGCALAWAGSRSLEAMLYGVKPQDPSVWLTALGAIALVCLAACTWAGRLATRVQPSQALRNE